MFFHKFSKKSESNIGERGEIKQFITSSATNPSLSLSTSENPRLEAKNEYLDLERRLSKVEIQLLELRTLLLEKDFKNPEVNRLSRFGKKLRAFH